MTAARAHASSSAEPYAVTVAAAAWTASWTKPGDSCVVPDRAAAAWRAPGNGRTRHCASCAASLAAMNWRSCSG